MFCERCRPAPCLSDGLHNRDQVDWRSGGLERSGPLHLSRGGPRRYRGVPAGTLARGPACARSFITSAHHGATHSPSHPTGHKDHRLVWWWQRWWRICGEGESLLSYSSTCLVSIVNSWSGQHPYVWHCGSHTPNKEYEDQALPPAWHSYHDNHWVSSRMSIAS